VSDARWVEIDRAVASAIRNFHQGVEFARHPDFTAGDLIGSALQMGCMHAIMSGHTSLENVLLRILDLLQEARPSGESWHADLIGRAGRAVAARPPILPPELAAAADETRKFRDRAMRSYDTFEPVRAGPAIAAAELLAVALPQAIAQFRGVIDP
jgi:hypothetical protein